MRWLVFPVALVVPAAFALACSSSSGNGNHPGDAGPTDSSKDGPADSGFPDTGPASCPPAMLDGGVAAGTFCSLPGSIVYTAGGPRAVPGGTGGAPCLSWLHLPVGFCAHYFATVPTTRQLRFAPDGRLFAASPSQGTTGGANNGTNAIVVLPDDNKDGVADDTVTFLGGKASPLPATQGFVFTGGYLYFQDFSSINRVAFKNGDMSPSGAVELVANITLPQAYEHWPKPMDVAQDGTFYVANGGSQSDMCVSSNPTRGAIVKLTGSTTSVVAKGFRNPIAVRCEKNHDVCLAAELALDYSGDQNGREKIVPIHQGDDWGYPCCATANTPYKNVVYADTHATPNCSGVATESDGFVIGHTPFGIDFETGKWPAPWTNRVFVTLHGVFGSWVGARVVGIDTDPNTGLPLMADDLNGDSPHMQDFAIGWDDGTLSHGRPAAVEFAPDGRMFVGDDQQGIIFWVAPEGLK
jgi:glucose/arabinose dehydrogenase